MSGLKRYEGAFICCGSVLNFKKEKSKTDKATTTALTEKKQYWIELQK